MKSYLQYARDIERGRIVSGNLMKLSVARFRRLKKDKRYVFNEDKVSEAIQFIGSLKHFTGKFNGKPFVLKPWQQYIVANIYGFYYKENKDKRLVQNVYIEMARKQGKTAFASALCLLHLIFENEMDAEVYLAANSKDQAKIAFKMCSNFVRSLDPDHEYLKPQRDRILFDETLSMLRVLAADDSKLDGFNASMFLLDEYHAAKNSRLKDVLQSSQGMRDNPMSMIITTAGFDKSSPCYQYRTMCTEILSGVKEDDSIFAVIYSLDEGDDWKDEGTWIKSNPNLDVTVKVPYIRQQVQKAKNAPSEEVGVKTKTLNIWCDSEEVWIPDHYIYEATEKVNLEDFKGCEAYAGVDLSTISDFTAMSLMIPKDGKLYFKTFYYLPEAALSEKRFSEQYGDWKRRGLMTITPGNVTDYDFILNDLVKWNSKLYISSVGYDAYNATQFVINAQDAGLKMDEVSQSIGNFNRPTKEMERLLLSGKAVIDNNEINRYCYRNVVLKFDWNGNAKPDKHLQEKKIDGVISQLMALSRYLSSPRYESVIY